MDAVEWSEILRWVPRQAQAPRDPEGQKLERCGAPAPGGRGDGADGCVPAGTP